MIIGMLHGKYVYANNDVQSHNVTTNHFTDIIIKDISVTFRNVICAFKLKEKNYTS